MTTFNADQLANGKAMAQQVADQPRRIQECVFTAGLVECSYLTSQMHTGDISSATGKQSSSLGWFQQTKAWGSAVDRINLATALQMFLHGGADHQQGLLDKDWSNTNISVPELCQQVQGSQFDGKTNWSGQGVLPRAQNYKDAYPVALEMLDLVKGDTMRMITDMADVLRAAGLTVIELPGWKTNAEDDGGFDPIGILFHHDAMGLHNMNVPTNMARRGEGGSQLWIRYDGVCVTLAAGRKWHAGLGIGYGEIGRDQGNTKMLGIETDYSGTGSWPAALVDSINRASAALAQHYGFPTSNCCGHKEYTRDTGRKIDPANYDLDAWRAQLGKTSTEAHPTAPAFPWPPTAPATPEPPKEWSDMATQAEIQKMVDDSVTTAVARAVRKVVNDYQKAREGDVAAGNEHNVNVLINDMAHGVGL